MKTTTLLKRADMMKKIMASESEMLMICIDSSISIEGKVKAQQDHYDRLQKILGIKFKEDK